MKFSSRKRRSIATELHMATMIDVVFLLLIFFMCTSSFSRPEDEMDVSSAVPGEMTDFVEFEPIRVALAATGSAVTILCDKTPCNDMLALKRQLAERRRLADASVIVEGDGHVPFETMIQAVETARHAKFSNVAFSIRRVK